MNIEGLFNNVLYATVFGSVVGVIIFTLKSTVLKKLPAKWQYLMWSVMLIKLVFPKGPESNISVFNKINVGKALTASEIGITKGLDLIGSDVAKREDVAVMVHNALDIPLMMQTGFGSFNQYVFMDGTAGYEYTTLRTRLDENL